MINPMHKPRSCRLFLVRDKLVILRDDFLSGGLRVGNTEEAEILSLSFGQTSQDEIKVGEAILQAFDQVEVIASMPERTPGYIPPYILATNHRNFKDFGATCSSCGCIESQDHVLLFPITYEPARRKFQQDRSNQVSSVLDPVVLGRTALTLLARFQ